MKGTGSSRSWQAGVLPALTVWWASRVALFVMVTLASYVLALPGPTRIHAAGGWLLERFVWWDAFHFLRIADRGYLPPGLPCCDQAFFPGYPFAIRVLAPLTGGSTVLSGLLVTQLAASVAVVLLWRLATESATDRRAGDAAVLLLAVTPFGLFLSSVYSEALFLAACLGAWLAGQHQRWWLAGVLAAAAAAVRINGLFLAAALAVMYLCQLRTDGPRTDGPRTDGQRTDGQRTDGQRTDGQRTDGWGRPRWDMVALALPIAVVAAYVSYLHARTGSWNDWQQAQVIAWHRQVAWPWQGLQAGWQSLVTAPSHDLVISRAADLITAVCGLLLVGVLGWRRRWAEAVFVGLNLTVLISSTTLVSSPRYALTWFPAYLMVARWSVRPAGRWVRPAALAIGPPLLAVLSLTFSIHFWVA